MSGFHVRIVDELDKMLKEVSEGALARPAERTEFEYGRVCGIYAGLQQARSKVLDILRDADEKGNNL